MKVTIFLSTHCAKYLATSTDLDKPIDFGKPFGRLIAKSLVERKPGSPPKCPPNLVQIDLKIPSSKNHPNIRPDRRNYMMPIDDMQRIDTYLDSLFRYELLQEVQNRGTRQKKDVFIGILERFNLTCDDFSFDAMAKFEQRHKNKSANSLIFG